MRIHYFQRYHEKENIATANTMLLLSRLYQYSSDKFFRFLKSEIFSDSFEPEIIFNLQERSVDSIPDATITQESKIVCSGTMPQSKVRSNQESRITILLLKTSLMQSRKLSMIEIMICKKCWKII